MKIIARHNVQLRGHIYAKGEAVEWDGPVTSRIADSFTSEDGTRLEADADSADGADPARQDGSGVDIVERTIAVLGRDGIMRQLDGMGISYPPTAASKYLAKLLLVQKGELDAQ